MAGFNRPLTNEDRIKILKRAESSAKAYLTDLEKEHFGITSYFPREMRDKFGTRLTDPFHGSFRIRYDDYLLDLWDSLENPVGGSATPIGLLLTLTRE